MKSRLFISGIGHILLFLATQTSFAQVITQVPQTQANSQYFSEIYSSVNRPGLSVIGFDNGGDHSKGKGLKQILNEVFTTGTNESKKLFIDILNIGDNNVDVTPPNADVIEENSNILQYRAFEALCSYVLEYNGIDSLTSNTTYNIPIRRFETVQEQFKQDVMALVNGSTNSYYNVNGQFVIGSSLLFPYSSDYLQDLSSYQNISRAIDLYLALENAYEEWSMYTGVTLSENEKRKLLKHFNSMVHTLKKVKIERTTPIGVTEDTFEPGNRPLKGYTTVGYASLASQRVGMWTYIDDEVDNGIYRASSPTDQNRDKKWMYQTSNGSRQWAEGPYYFQYALNDVIPFWHAVRANNMLGATTDPFTSGYFITPIKWLADISTPDGMTPPLDDGNKHPIYNSVLLRWSSSYGNSEVGKKFNAIHQSLKQYHPNGFSNQTYLLELAIPKTTSSIPIDYDVKNVGDHQYIIRHHDADGKLHYLLLNGETGDAITRGEGHEQPDQMQFLYYVDDVSYHM